MQVRPRTPSDVDECVRIAEAVHDQDGYPAYLATSFKDFIVTDDALATWVAEHDGAVIGHAALHRHTIPDVLTIASDALGRPIDQLGVVARLFVDPERRQLGAGDALLEQATLEARSRGLWPILDVCSDFTAAITLYERRGWTRVGHVDLVFGDLALTELVFIARESPH